MNNNNGQGTPPGMSPQQPHMQPQQPPMQPQQQPMQPPMQPQPQPQMQPPQQMPQQAQPMPQQQGYPPQQQGYPPQQGAPQQGYPPQQGVPPQQAQPMPQQGYPTAQQFGQQGVPMAPDFHQLMPDNLDMTSRTNRLPYFEPGDYRVRVTRVKSYYSKDPTKGRTLYFTIEAEILQSNQPQRPIGMLCSHVINISKEMGMQDMKRFVASANQLSPDNPDNNARVNAGVIQDVVGTEQPLAGVEMLLHCYATSTRNGGTFTVHRWEHPDGYTQ